MKKFLSILLALVFVLATIPLGIFSINASAANEGYSLANPKYISFGTTYYKGWYSGNDHLNYFVSFTVTQRGIVNINATKPYDAEGEYGELEFTVYDNYGEPIWGNDSRWAEDNGKTSYNVSLGLDPGTYVLKIYPGFYVSSGIIETYYKLSFTANQYVEVECNDTAMYATPINLYKTYTGFVGRDGSSYDTYDYYKLNIKKDHTYRITYLEGYRYIDQTNTYIYAILPDGEKESIYGCDSTIDSKGYNYTEFKSETSGTAYIYFDSDYFEEQFRYSFAIYDMTEGYNPAKITKQPVSVRVANGKTAKVTVTATGSGLTYKWYFKDKNASKFSLTNSYKGASYDITMNSEKAGRQVYCVVSDQYGNSVKTNTVTLNMSNLKITKQPTNVAVQNGKTAKVTVAASGEGLKYKWYFKNKGDSKFTLTTSFTSSSYSIAMNNTRAGRQVYCVITDKYGASVKTNTVTLGMPVKITKQPATVAVQSGKTAKVTVTATGDGLTYKWYFKNKGDSKFSLTNTFKSNYYSATMDSTRAGRQVYCVITDKYGNKVQTKTVTLGMAAKITTQPTSVNVANGKAAKVTVKASGDGLKYKWYFKDKGASKFTLTTTFTGTSYSVAMSNARAGRQVYCVITDKYGNSVKTNTVTLNKK